MSEVLFCAKDMARTWNVHPGHASRRIRKLVKEGKAEFAFRDTGKKMYRWKTPEKQGGFTPRTQVTQIAPKPAACHMPVVTSPLDDGYLYLKEGDTIERGDEYGSLYAGKLNWTIAERIGGKVMSHMRYRRKKPVATPAPAPTKPGIDPGVGYRLLEVGEIVQEGDEYHSPASNTWWKTGDAGQKQGTYTTRRRKITKGTYYLAGPVDIDDETAQILIARNYPVSQRAW